MIVLAATLEGVPAEWRSAGIVAETDLDILALLTPEFDGDLVVCGSRHHWITRLAALQGRHILDLSEACRSAQALRREAQLTPFPDDYCALVCLESLQGEHRDERTLLGAVLQENSDLGEAARRFCCSFEAPSELTEASRCDGWSALGPLGLLVQDCLDELTRARPHLRGSTYDGFTIEWLGMSCGSDRLVREASRFAALGIRTVRHAKQLLKASAGASKDHCLQADPAGGPRPSPKKAEIQSQLAKKIGGNLVKHHRNRLVDFIRLYGPCPAQDNLYDEGISRNLRTFNIAPIETEPQFLGDILENYRSKSPHTHILTGTAGDGKTFHCRKCFEELGGDPTVWVQGSKDFRLTLPFGRELIIVKDLSELTPKEKDRMLRELMDSVAGDTSKPIYLLAANDGQLLASLKPLIDLDDGVFCGEVEDLLVQDKSKPKKLAFSLLNLSRTTSTETFDSLITAVTEHPGWSDCDGCPVFESCCIRTNRNRLKGGAQNKRFRTRLAHLVRLCSNNNFHITVRQMLILISNILLGVKHQTRDSSMNCSRVQEEADIGLDRTNPYELAFGYNLKSSVRRQHDAFEALRSFGIGWETQNRFDSFILFGGEQRPNDFERDMLADKQFGYNLLREHREDYLGERKHPERFKNAMKAQRRRLFFELYDEEEIWQLTGYRFAGRFLNFLNTSNTSSKARIETERDLLIGLNRSFCGLAVNKSDPVYLTQSSGSGDNRISRYICHEATRKKKPSLRFEFDSGRPIIRLCGEKSKTLAKQSLNLDHFEYLIRLRNGYLPTSFSTFCFQDFRDFKLEAISELDKDDQAENDGQIFLDYLVTDDDDEVRTESLEILCSQIR
jgi:hypothetical protein